MRFGLLLGVCVVLGLAIARPALADEPAKPSTSSKKPSRLAENLRAFDVNDDGELDAAERKAYNASKKNGGQEGPDRQRGSQQGPLEEGIGRLGKLVRRFRP